MNDLPEIDENLSYESGIAIVESIVDQIEKGDVPIDEIFHIVEKATQYIRFCRDKISSTEKKVDQLVESLQNEIESPT